jgi:hypothetical protein
MGNWVLGNLEKTPDIYGPEPASHSSPVVWCTMFIQEKTLVLKYILYTCFKYAHTSGICIFVPSLWHALNARTNIQLQSTPSLSEIILQKSLNPLHLKIKATLEQTRSSKNLDLS